MAPKVTVLMSVYNGERYLQEAIDSILNQTFTDFEFVIINDGSTDGTQSILDRCGDSRIMRLQNEQNIGLTRSLNRGLKVARGRFIARQDVDDISLPTRLATQMSYLEEHPQVGVLGTQITRLNRYGLYIEGMKLPCSHSLIVWTLLFRNAMAHPTVMMRKSVLEQVNGYDPSFQVTQDYELWTRLVGTTQLANLPEVLVIHRTHPNTVSSHQFEMQKANNLLAFQRLVSRLLGKIVPSDNLEWVRSSQSPGTLLTVKQLKQVIALLLDLYAVMLEKRLLNDGEGDEVYEDMLDRIIVAGRCMSRSDLVRAYWWSVLPMPLWQRVTRILTALVVFLRSKSGLLHCNR